jgi:hypothetical protein
MALSYDGVPAASRLLRARIQRVRCTRGRASMLGLLLLLGSGCATTQPWERETLAKRCMAPDPDPFRAALRHHYLSTREGAVGGLGGGGGGCGCN